MSAQARQQRLHGTNVVTLPGHDTERNGATTGIHSLRGLAATRIRTVQVKRVNPMCETLMLTVPKHAGQTAGETSDSDRSL